MKASLKVLKCTKTKNNNYILTVEHDWMLFGQPGLKVSIYYVAAEVEVPTDTIYEDDLAKYRIEEHIRMRKFTNDLPDPTDPTKLVPTEVIEKHTYRWLTNPNEIFKERERA